MEKTIYIVSSRCGAELEEPEIFYTPEDADKYVTTCIANDILEDFREDIAEDLKTNTKITANSVDDMTPEEIVAWGEMHDYCTSNTYTYSSDWHEFNVQEKQIEINPKIYCVRMYDDEIDMIVGYATTKAKAQKMIDILENTDGFESCQYEYYAVFLDTLEINDKPVYIK